MTQHAVGAGTASGNATVRRHNKTAALQHVFSGAGTATRAGIARATGLTSATVSSLLTELIDDGFVVEGSLAESTGGKRATTLHVDAMRHVVLAILVTPRLVRGAILNLVGEVLETAVIHPAGRVTVDDVRRMAKRLSAATSASIIATGVQLSGTVEGQLLRESVQLGWRDLNLGDELAVTGAPVFLINDADGEALAELSSADYVDSTHMFVSLSTGVGASIMLHGELFHGATGRVGEIGHVPVLFRDDAPMCPCGSRGCLEELVSVTSLLGLEHGADLEAVDVGALARLPENRERIAAGARTLARVVLSLGAAIDVPSVVIGGYAPLLGPEFLGHMRAEAARHPVRGVMPLSIRYASNTRRGPFRGAAQFALNAALGVSWSR